MKLAVSNIAWTANEESLVADKLRELGVKYVEIAPTKIWSDPTKVSVDDARRYVEWWAKYDINVSAFQSMLFARPDLEIFKSKVKFQETVEYMSKFLELAGVMGARKLVFGSPKNRQRGDMSIEEAKNIAVSFFDRLGSIAADNGVVLCLEPNAKQYNCDFITNATEGSELVRKVDNKGFGLHLDTACMALAGDDIGLSIRENKDMLEHFHISSPMLGLVENIKEINHIDAANALKAIGYDKIISIEMRSDDAGKNIERVSKAVEFVKDIYLS